MDDNYKFQKAKSFKDWLKQKIERFIDYRNPLARGMSYGMVARKL